MKALRPVGMVLVVGLVLATLAAAHYYLLLRLVLDPAWLGAAEDAVVAAVVFLGVGCVLQPGLERILPAPWFRWLSWPFLIWMGLFWIGFNATWIGDLVTTLGSALGAPVPTARGYATVLGGTIGVLSLIALVGGTKAPALKRVDHVLSRWPSALDGFRILQISDIHIGPILARPFAQQLADRINERDADLVVITGDLVDGRVDQLRDDVIPFGEIQARHGVFFVTGNHDIYSGDRAWVERIRELGIQPLRNERLSIAPQPGASFELAGVDDHRGDMTGKTTEDLPKALEGWDRDQPLILLAHDPSTFKRAHPEGIDLQLSGHTHGGQIWPFRWMVRAVIPWVAGSHRQGSSQLYVSRGTGFWGPPMRLLAPAEITEHVLRSSPT